MIRIISIQPLSILRFRRKTSPFPQMPICTKDRPKGFVDRTEENLPIRQSYARMLKGIYRDQRFRNHPKNRQKQEKRIAGYGLMRGGLCDSSNGICRNDSLVQTGPLTRAQIDRQDLFSERASRQMYRQREGTKE